MQKSLLSAWLSVIVFLGIGSYVWPESIIFSQASGDFITQLIRIAVVVTIVSQLFTEPPRNLLSRSFIGTMSILLIVWSVNGAIGFDIKAFDTISFIGAAFAAAVTALEASQKPGRSSGVLR